jgi:hypothetical protein
VLRQREVQVNRYSIKPETVGDNTNQRESGLNLANRYLNFDGLQRVIVGKSK